MPDRRLVALDDPAATDPNVVGAKAAWLARGRAAGLPILPGVVIRAAESRAALAAGAAALAVGGSGRARLTIMREPLDGRLIDAVAAAVVDLGPSLVVRSSSRLEGDPVWAGAFTSYVDVRPAELPTAIRGCWASVFAPATVERHDRVGLAPGAEQLALLVQPALRADSAGTARLLGDAVQIEAVAGSPAPLLQGWDPGVRGRVEADGTVDGADLRDLVGNDHLGRLADVLREARAAIGATACEWAVAGDACWLLQLVREPTGGVGEDAALPALDGPADLLALLAGVAAIARRAPGVLGEALVLPWAVALAVDPGGGPSGPDGRVGWAGPSRGGWPADGPPPGDATDAAEALRHAGELAPRLAADVWDAERPAALAQAGELLRALRGEDPMAAADRLRSAGLRQPDPARVDQLLGWLAIVRHALARSGAVPDPGAAWAIAPDEATRLLEGPGTHARARIGYDRWEPFQAAVVLATGLRVRGTPSGPGLGVGRLARVADARDPGRIRSRDVIVATRPLPHLAPLLWDAAGIVTLGGGPGAHLFESARALGLPAVSSAPVDDALACAAADGPAAIAVDGWSGMVAVTPW